MAASSSLVVGCPSSKAVGFSIVKRDILTQRRTLGVLCDVIQENLAAHAGENSGGSGADLAGADDAGRPAMHVEAEQTVDGKIALADAVERLVKLSIEREHHADG